MTYPAARPVANETAWAVQAITQGAYTDVLREQTWGAWRVVLDAPEKGRGVEGHPVERMARRRAVLRQAPLVQAIPAGRLKLTLTGGEPESSPAAPSLE